MIIYINDIGVYIYIYTYHDYVYCNTKGCETDVGLIFCSFPDPCCGII